MKLIGKVFMDPGKIKRVEVNNENIQYYNKVYEDGRSEEAKVKIKLKQERLEKMKPNWI